MRTRLFLASAISVSAAALACTNVGVKVWVGGDGNVTGELGMSCNATSSPCISQVTPPSHEWFLAEANSGSDFISWDGCPESHGEYCKVTYNVGDTEKEFAAMFAPSSAPKVQVQACTSGILPHAKFCSPYVGKTFALVFEGNTFQAVGWDNRVYTGGYIDNKFSGKSGGELITAVDNGTNITIALWPKGYSGCSSSVPNCVVSLVTQAQ